MERKKISINDSKMTFKGYYLSLTRNKRSDLRDRICLECDMKYPTFYYKFQTESFSKLEMERISELFDVDPIQFFPELNTYYNYGY